MDYEIFCIYVKSKTYSPGIEDFASLVRVCEEHNIVDVTVMPDWEDDLRRNFKEDMKKIKQFTMFFKPTVNFIGFLQSCFEFHFEDKWKEAWSQANGREVAVGFTTRDFKDPEWIEHGIESNFMFLRLTFQNIRLKSLFKEYTSLLYSKYGNFILDAEQALNKKIAIAYLVDND